MGRETEAGKALFVWNKKERLHGTVVELIESLKNELHRVGIGSVTEEVDDDHLVTLSEEEEEEDEEKDKVTKGCNLAVIFITPRFLEYNLHYLGMLIERFRRTHCIAFIIDDDKKEFVEFIRQATYDCGEPGDADPHPIYKVPVNDVNVLVGCFISPWAPYRFTNIVPGEKEDYPHIVRVFGEKVLRGLNSTGIDFNKFNPVMYSSLKLLDKQILFNCKNIMKLPCDDSLFVILVGCQCRCFDMSPINIFLYRLNVINNRGFYYRIRFSASKLISDSDKSNPLAVRDIFLRHIYGKCKSFDAMLSKRCKDEKDHYQVLVQIEDFDFSIHHLALSQLRNLANVLGKGSLVFVTTTVTKELADYQNLVCLDPASLDAGTTCKEPIKWRLLHKSELNQPEEETVSSLMDVEVDQRPALQQGPKNEILVSLPMDTESIEREVSASVAKKPKLTSS